MNGRDTLNTAIMDRLKVIGKAKTVMVTMGATEWGDRTVTITEITA
jgi:hypothetical protein